MEVTKKLLALILASVFAYSTAAATKKIFHLSPESGEKVVESILKCIAKLKLDTIVIELIKQGKYADDDRIMEAFICMNVERGLGTAEGRLDVDAMMKDVFSNNPHIRKALETCEKDYGTTPVLNLKHTLTCVRENLPFRIKL